jgi:uncharacterized membrane protein YhaH (DUF805 family)
VTFQDAVKVCFSKYVDFNGRARRSEFWWWVLFTFLLGIVASIVDSVLGTRSSTGTGLVESVTNLAVLLPSLAVGARRLHDTGRSGWWLLLWLVCLIGWIILIVWFCQGSHGDNKYGASPKRGVAGPGGPPAGPYGAPPAAPPSNPYGDPPAPPSNPYGDPPA